MKIINLKTKDLVPYIPNESVVALGNFDGVHIGHRKIISTAVNSALAHGYSSAVMFFERLPFSSKAIMSCDLKIEAIEGLFVDYCVILDFDSVRDFSPRQFVEDILVKSCSCKIAVCGQNYHFGNDGIGDAELLLELMKSTDGDCDVVPLVSFDNCTVSSSLIRTYLASGEIERANMLLSSPYTVLGNVVSGKALGRRMGVPTVNVNFPDGAIIPHNGVYISKTKVVGSCDENSYVSVTNIGTRPTVNGETLNCETHIIDREYRVLYGQQVAVELYKKIRDEIKFSSVEELVLQINRDIEDAKKYFNIETEV